MKMNDLIETILLRLEERRRSQTTITVYNEVIYSEEILLHHQTICLAGIDYGHLQSLKHNTRVPWIRFLDKALAYDCDITLKLSVPASSLLNPLMLWTWPVIFRDKLNRRIYAFNESWISLSMIRACEAESIIVLKAHQKLTNAAVDECRRLHINTIEGSD